MSRKDLFAGLTEEQIIKVKACKNIKEIFLLAKQEGIELNEDQLAAVCGGGCTDPDAKPIVCPKCGERNADNLEIIGDWDGGFFRCKCKKCGHEWIVYY